MTVQRRLLVWLTLIAAAIWLVALLGSYWFARAEVDELFDTRQLTLARLVLTQLPGGHIGADSSRVDVPESRQGAAEPEDIIIAVWNRDGELLSPADGTRRLPFDWNLNGFVFLNMSSNLFCSLLDHIRSKTSNIYILTSSQGVLYFCKKSF